MPKEPTDYVLLYLGHSQKDKKIEWVCHKKHVRKKDLDMTKTYYEEFGGNMYKFMPNRALRLKGWIPWRMWKKKHPFASIAEILRTKRIGLLIYLDPIFLENPQDLTAEEIAQLNKTLKEAANV